jgi:hypothetical protein
VSGIDVGGFSRDGPSPLMEITPYFRATEAS